jgi:hypothetical protein
VSAVVLLLALRPHARCTTSVLFPADYDDEFDSVFGTEPHARAGPRPVPGGAVYVSAPDDPATRPDEDHESWFVLVNAPGTTRPASEESTGTARAGRRYADMS